jgi:fucose permease
MLGLFITGLGVASMYPMILSLVIGSAGGSTVEASAFSSLASGVAILFLPLILGRLADAVGIHSAYLIVLLLLAIAFVIIQATVRLTRLDAKSVHAS